MSWLASLREQHLEDSGRQDSEELAVPTSCGEVTELILC